MTEMVAYTDGGVDPASGAGGVGFVLLLGTGEVLLAGARHHPGRPTNQQMEIRAAAAGIRAAAARGASAVTVRSDSAYVVNCLRDRWFLRWMTGSPRWTNSQSQPVANAGEWADLLSLCPSVHAELASRLGPSPWRRLRHETDQAIAKASLAARCGVRFEKVRGHSGDRFNELADRLATEGKMGREA